MQMHVCGHFLRLLKSAANQIFSIYGLNFKEMERGLI